MRNPRPIPLDRKKLKQFAGQLTHSLRIMIKKEIRELGGNGTEGFELRTPTFESSDFRNFIYQPINDHHRYYALVERPFIIADVRGDKKAVAVQLIFSTRSTATGVDGQPNMVLPEWFSTPAPYIIGAFAGRACSDESQTDCTPVVGIIFNGWKTYAEMNRYLSDPDYKSIRDKITQGIYSELLHEFTHIRDIIPVGAEKDKAWGARKHEGRAVMQQVVDEVLTVLETQPAKKGMFRMFYFDDVVAKLSPRYAKAEQQMTEENLQRILSAVYQAMVENGYSFKRHKRLQSLR